MLSVAAERVKAMNRGLRKILLFLLIWLLCIPQVGFAESKGNPWPYFFDIRRHRRKRGTHRLIDTEFLKYIDESRIAEGKLRVSRQIDKRSFRTRNRIGRHDSRVGKA